MNDEHSIDTTTAPGTALLRGVFRLESPDVYDRLFAPILASILAAGASGYEVDIRDVALMNSSGIRALADLILAARRVNASVTLRARSGVPWQRKTMASLQPMYARLTVAWS